MVKVRIWTFLPYSSSGSMFNVYDAESLSIGGAIHIYRKGLEAITLRKDDVYALECESMEDKHGE